MSTKRIKSTNHCDYNVLSDSADAASSDGFPNYTLFDDCAITIKEFGLQNCDQLLCVDLTMDHEE